MSQHISSRVINHTMSLYEKEPLIDVGLVEETDEISFELSGDYVTGSSRLDKGFYTAKGLRSGVFILDKNKNPVLQSEQLEFIPQSSENPCFTIHNIIIGKQFHWEREQKQTFEGAFLLKKGKTRGITFVNRLSMENYLKSVICSEMSSDSPFEFLKAHCVISRSWTLAQIRKKSWGSESSSGGTVWTDAKVHTEFDLCADDHCQRYHGTGAVNLSVRKALESTFGEILTSRGSICDTRFSKCCGGITEKFSTAWQEIDFEYLQPVGDAPEGVLPVYNEKDAESFIRSTPDVFCNVSDRYLLEKILPGFDFETENFFRWEISFSQEELKNILLQKTGIDFGFIKKITPLERGPSGRIFRLRIEGEKEEKLFGKELEIRRILSKTHLYSSAFIVEPWGGGDTAEGFNLIGAGWGHGVGLCQIGAASMALKGYNYREILSHYFKNTSVQKIY